MIDKTSAGYQISPGSEQCANCVMFHWGSCDLVYGMIEPYAVCAYYEQNPGDMTSVAQHLAEKGEGNVPFGL